MSLANLGDEDYEKIGAYMREVAEEYLEAWRAGKIGRHFKVIPLPSWSGGEPAKAEGAKKTATPAKLVRRLR